MNNDDEYKLRVALKFKTDVLRNLKEIKNMVQCIIPLDTKDKKVLRQGLDKIESFRKQLEEADTLLELSQLFDVDRVVAEYDEISREVNSTTDYASFCSFMNKIETMVDGEE